MEDKTIIKNTEIDGYVKNKQMQFQVNATTSLLNILKNNSRAFLADEAGLGKTYSATGVLDKMACEFWENERNKNKPFVVIYVAPNTALLEKNSNEIASKSRYKNEIINLGDKESEEHALNMWISRRVKKEIGDIGTKIRNKLLGINKDIQTEITVEDALNKMSVGDPVIREKKEEILNYYNKNNQANERTRIKNAFDNVIRKGSWNSVYKQTYMEQLHEVYKLQILNRILLSYNINKYKDWKNTKIDYSLFQNKGAGQCNPGKKTLKREPIEELYRDLKSKLKDEFRSRYNTELKNKSKFSARKHAHQGMFGKGSSEDWKESFEEHMSESCNRLIFAYNILIRNKYLNQKKIILIPISSNLLGYSGSPVPKSEKKLIEYYGGRLKLTNISSYNKRKIFKLTDIGLYNKSEPREKRGIMEILILKELEPKLVIWDEYHRYFDRVSSEIIRTKNDNNNNIDINSLRWYEENSDMKALFLSATPYKNNISGDKNKDANDLLDKEETKLITLPSFEDFAKLFYQGKGKPEELEKCPKAPKELHTDFMYNWIVHKTIALLNLKERSDDISSDSNFVFEINDREFHCENSDIREAWKKCKCKCSKINIANNVKDLKSINKKYLKSLETLLSTEENFDDNWRKAAKAKQELEKKFSAKMVRHERTILNDNIREEHELLFSSEDIYKDDSYKKILKNTWKQMKTLRAYKYQDGAINLSKNMPWVLTFSTRYKSIGKNKTDENKKGYFQLLEPTEELKNSPQSREETLFLYESRNGKLNNMNTNIKTLPEQNLGFKQLCESNLKESMSQLIWVPATVPFYKIPEESIFNKYRDYSKTLVFGEYVYLQRGGSLLLSEYADFLNQTNKVEARKHNDITLDWNKHTKYLLEISEIYDPENLAKNLDDIVSSITGHENFNKIKDKIKNNSGKDVSDNKIALAAIASPAVCAERLGLDPKNVESSFNKYFNKSGIKNALKKWMDNSGINDYKEGVLRYCAEGNLMAVLEEWKMCNNNVLSENHIENILNYSPSKVHVQTLETTKNETDDGLERQNSFADRLTHDHNDNGSTNDDEWHNNLQNAFNSPFLPMVLFVGRGSQEGLDFHSYCLRIMHLTLPRGAVSFEQRQGRIDRFRSLLVRRRVVEYFKNMHIEDNTQNLILRMFGTLVKEKEKNPEKFPELYPNWQMPKDNINKFERIVAVWDLSSEQLEYEKNVKRLNCYRSSFGSMELMDDIIALIEGRDKNINISDILLDLSAKSSHTGP